MTSIPWNGNARGWGSKEKCPPWGVWIFFWDYTIGLPCLLIELFSLVCLCCGRTSYGHVITKNSRMGRLPHFLKYEATLAWSSAMTLPTHACPYYSLQLTFTHLLLVNVPLVPLSLASAQVIKERKKHDS